MIEPGTTIGGFQKCARCHSSPYFSPTRARSGAMPRLPNDGGTSKAYSPGSGSPAPSGAGRC